MSQTSKSEGTEVILDNSWTNPKCNYNLEQTAQSSSNTNPGTTRDSTIRQAWNPPDPTTKVPTPTQSPTTQDVELSDIQAELKKLRTNA